MKRFNVVIAIIGLEMWPQPWPSCRARKKLKKP